MELRQCALELLCLADPAEKAMATRALFDRVQALPLNSAISGNSGTNGATSHIALSLCR